MQPFDEDPLKAPTEIVVRQTAKRKQGHIRVRRGHKIWRVHRVTMEVSEVISEVSKVVQQANSEGMQVETLRHRVTENDTSYFYTSALNKKNALKHYKSTIYHYGKHRLI